jgi:tRNAHis guanylyltransferase
MQFEALDHVMRVFETAHDHCVLPGLWMVARLDGRSFTRLVREVHPFEAPFDARFRDMMVATTRHLMSCGFNVVYGCTHSDEISLLFHPQEDSFGRKLRKLISVLAGEASAAFALQLGSVACFDAHRAAAVRAAGGGLLPLAGGGRAPQRAECPLLLAAARAGALRPRGRRADRRAVHRVQERAVIPARRQLQRGASLAEARRRARLGDV